MEEDDKIKEGKRIYENYLKSDKYNHICELPTDDYIKVSKYLEFCNNKVLLNQYKEISSALIRGIETNWGINGKHS